MRRSPGAAPLFLAVAAWGCGGTSYYVRPGLEPALPSTDDVLLGRLLLVGEAGEPRAPEDPQQQATDRTFDALRGDAARDPERTTVVFLGDNVSPRGLPLRPGASSGTSPCTARGGEPSPDEAERVLRRQIEAAGPARLALFLPGNHDWHRGGDCGWPRVLAQERFLEGGTGELGKTWPGSVALVPDGGCPGPVALDLPATRPAFRVIAMDTEWLLRDAGRDGTRKPIRACARGLGLPETAGEAEVRGAFLKKLGEAVAGSERRPVVLVSHHPLQTHGSHRGGKNRAMVRDIVEALAAVPHAPTVIAAAGHDHDLQVLELPRGARFQLVSGAGSRVTPVGQGPDTLFKDAARGYLRLDFVERKGKRLARLSAIGADAGGPHQLFTFWLEGPLP